MKYMLSGAGVTRSPTVYKACNNAEEEEEENKIQSPLRGCESEYGYEYEHV